MRGLGIHFFGKTSRLDDMTEVLHLVLEEEAYILIQSSLLLYLTGIIRVLGGLSCPLVLEEYNNII